MTIAWTSENTIIVCISMSIPSHTGLYTYYSTFPFSFPTILYILFTITSIFKSLICIASISQTTLYLNIFPVIGLNSFSSSIHVFNVHKGCKGGQYISEIATPTSTSCVISVTDRQS